MMNVLLETRAPRQRRVGWMLTSVLAHSALLALAVRGSARGEGPPPPIEPDPAVIWMVPEPAPPVAGPTITTGGATGETGSPSPVVPPVVPPMVEPVGIPPVDVGAPVVGIEVMLPRVPLAGGASGATAGGGARVGGAYLASDVERPAIAAPGNRPPVYPPALERLGVEGRVVAQFVVDTLGRADLRTLRVLESNEPRFEAAVRAALPAYRFLPAEAGGRKVPMWVQLPFAFAAR